MRKSARIASVKELIKRLPAPEDGDVDQADACPRRLFRLETCLNTSPASAI